MHAGSLVFAFSAACCGANESLTDVVARYGIALDKYDTCKYVARGQTYYRGPASEDEVLASKEEWTVRHDGDRWNVRYEGAGGNFHEGVKQNWFSAIEYLVRPDGSIHVQRTGDPPELGVSATLDVLKVRPARMYLGAGGSLMGYLPADGQVRLDEILRGPRVVLRADQVVEGRPTLLLEASSNLGIHRVWFAPSQGDFPHRIEVVKRGSDLCWGRPLTSVPLAPAGGAMPTTKLETYTIVIDRVVLNASSDAWNSYVETVTYAYAGGQLAVFRTEFQISDIELVPKFTVADFEIETPVPEGTSVTVEDATQIEYRWQDGWPRKFVDRGSLPSAPSDGFQTDGTGSEHAWLFFLSALATVSLAAWFAYSRLTSRHG